MKSKLRMRNRFFSVGMILFLMLFIIACGGGGGDGGDSAPPTYNISGAVSGATLTGVTINLTGAATTSTTTDASGNFSITGLANGAYTVTPSLAGYTFTPPSSAATVNGANITGQNFVATATGPTISSLSANSAAPMNQLTITVAGFDPAATLKVSFFDNNGFKLDIPVLEATSTSITVAVPPYISPSTGMFGPGTVNVRVLQNSTGSIAASNTIAGFQIGSLPTLTLPPGSVTANVASFLELALTDTINRLSELDTSSGSQINTVDLRAKLESIRLQYGQLKSKIRNAIANPGQAETIGEINGVPISLDQENLRIADQLMVAIINGILPQLQVATSLSKASLLSARDSYSIELTGLSTQCDPDDPRCNMIPVFNGLTGETTDVSKYEYAIALPGASKELDKLSKWFAAITGTITVTLASAGVDIPLLVVAAITNANIVAMSAKFGIDRAWLSAKSNDPEAAKSLDDDFRGLLQYMRDSVLSPTIWAIKKEAGIIYDLYTAWEPIVEDKIPVFITQVINFIDKVVPPTCTFFTYSAWSVCQPDNTQTRTVISSTPAGCTGGDPIKSQSCTYTPSDTIPIFRGTAVATGTSSDPNIATSDWYHCLPDPLVVTSTTTPTTVELVLDANPLVLGPISGTLYMGSSSITTTSPQRTCTSTTEGYPSVWTVPATTTTETIPSYSGTISGHSDGTNIVIDVSIDLPSYCSATFTGTVTTAPVTGVVQFSGQDILRCLLNGVQGVDTTTYSLTQQ